MAKLKNTHKELIVKSLACYLSPKDIITLFKKDYGIELTYNQVAFYNLSTLASAGLTDRWRVLFHATREKYLGEIEAVPLAYKAYRLNILQKNLDKALSKDNIVLANQILELAAKEMGGVYERGEGGNGGADRGRNVFDYLKEINQRILDSGALDD